MTDKHTPTPWAIADKYGPCNVTAAGGRSICSTGGYSDNFSDPETRVAENAANARRIVACVNALSGTPTESIESGAVAELVSAARALLDQCDRIAMPVHYPVACESLRTALAAIQVKP